MGRERSAGDKATLKERLESLASFLPEFESPDFSFGEMVNSPGGMPYYRRSPAASRFVEAGHKSGWIQPFDWGKWMRTDEAIRLRDDRKALEEATPEQLSRILTVLVRQDRFVEGSLAGAFEAGMLTRILRRISALAADPSLSR